MHLSWLGVSAVKLETKDCVLVTDPYAPSVASRPLRAKADVVTVSDSSSALANHVAAISGAPFVIRSPGEYEVKGIFLHGIVVGKTTVFAMDLEDLRVACFGLAATMPDDDTLEKLNGIDVLVVPVGGGRVYEPAVALRVVNAIEPSVVVPVAYAVAGLTVREKFGAVQPFLKEMGGTKVEPVEKVILKKRDLREEETQVVLLKP